MKYKQPNKYEDEDMKEFKEYLDKIEEKYREAYRKGFFKGQEIKKQGKMSRLVKKLNIKGVFGL